jgi:S1-C subfamily serine protease
VGGSADVTHASFLRGAMVTYVAPGSPAGRAGLAPGAQIVALDGRPVRCALDLVTLLQTRRPGQSVRLRWIDDLWRTHTATAVLTRGVPQ